MNNQTDLTVVTGENYEDFEFEKLIETADSIYWTIELNSDLVSPLFNKCVYPHDTSSIK